MTVKAKTGWLRSLLPVLAGGAALGLLLAMPPATSAQDKKDKQEKKNVPPNIPAEFEKLFDQLQKMIGGQIPGGLPGGFGGIFPFGNVDQPNRLGATLEEPGAALADQLGLPAKQGILLKDLRAESAAAKAGLKTNDILLELAGKPVPSNVEDFIQQVNDIKKDAPVDAVVLRKGKKETIKGLKLGDVPPPAENPFGGFGGFPLKGGIPLKGGGGIQIQGGNAIIGPDGSRSSSTTRGPNGEFTTRYKEGKVQITVAGKVEGGKANIASIEVRDGDKSNTYKSVNDVPEDLREDVRALIRQAEGGQGGPGLPGKKDR